MEKKTNMVLAVPKVFFYAGWFAELPVEVNDIRLGDNEANIDIINSIIHLIETKTILLVNEKVAFEKNNWLTPAIWLDVPKDWRNKYDV